MFLWGIPGRTAVHPNRLGRKRSYRQRQGREKKLLEHVEQLLIDRGERVLLVETAGTEDFGYVRAFSFPDIFAQNLYGSARME